MPADPFQIPIDERRRLFAPIVAVGVALIALVWVSVVYKAQADREMVIRAINTSNLNLARAFEEHTVRTIKSADQAVLFLKYQYEKLGSAMNIADYVRQGTIINSLFNQIGVIDEKGMYILSNLPDHRPRDLSDREHFLVHRGADTGALYISKPVLGRASGKWSIQLTRRINKPDGSFGGVIVVSMDPHYFSEFYKGVDLGRSGVVSLVGRDGIVRARRAGENIEVGQDLSGTPLMRLGAQAESGHYNYASKADGVRRFYSFRVFQEYPLLVSVGVGEDEALEEFHLRRTGYMIYAGVMSLMVVVFGALAIRMLDRQYRISAALRESQARAEEANRMKSEFLASMSHELRTPLNGIMGYAEFLRDSSTDTPREFAGIILESSQHLLELVNSILDLAKVEAGQMVLELREVPLRPLVERVIQSHRPPALEKGLVLTAEVADDVPETLRCDSTRLSQVLINLLDNAIKFTDEGRVALSVTRNGADLQLKVTDTGCGIAEDMQAHVFERFRQVESFLTRRHAGTGLGLALVKELTALMGGNVILHSTPGKGSEFVINLPLDLQEHRT